MEVNTISTILELIHDFVKKNPHHIALEFENEILTYEEVNRSSNQLAHYLLKSGLTSEMPIGLYVKRSADLVIGMLGIFKAGGTYIPLDPEHPPQRILSLIKDTKIKIVLTHESLSAPLSGLDSKLIALDTLQEEIKKCHDINPPLPMPQNVSYVMFTSGTTGKPKGVELEHKTFAIRYGFSPYYHLMNESDRLAAITAVSWNPSVYEIFYTLARGARIVLCSTETMKDPSLLQKFIANKKITFMRAVPSLWQALIDAGWQGKSDLTIVSHGEKLDTKLGEKLQPRGKAIYNTYGSTEATVFSLVQVSSDHKRVIPLVASQERGELMVLDENLNPVASGESGELYVRGPVIARGYFDDKKLTDEKFIWNQDKTDRLYKTGDLAKKLDDGNLEFLGRADNQVKIRGQRIELGEIEAAIAKYPKVKEVVVHTADDGLGGLKLIAYVIPEEVLSTAALRQYLNEILPSAMVPSHYVSLEKFPLNENGKVNRKALPLPEVSNGEKRSFVPCENKTQESVAKIFSDILKVEHLNLDDQFFELGGHSLSAALVCSRIRELFSVNISLAYFFQHPTVKALAIEIERLQSEGITTGNNDIKIVQNRKQAVLSFAQERLWFINKLAGKDAGYNLPNAIRLKGKLNTKALQESLNLILKRHEALRTSFHLDKDGKPFQTVQEENLFPLKLIPEKNEDVIREDIASDSKLDFDLSQAPLIRGQLYQLSETEHILYINMHHIVSDGWSRAVFTQELVESYNALDEGKLLSLKQLPVQYVDFAHWHRTFLSQEELKRQKQYWVQELRGLEPLNMPTDRPRPRILSQRGDQEVLIIPPKILQRLRDLALKHNSSLYMVLLSAYQLLLYRYCGQVDIAVGSPIAGRVKPEIEGLIGFFVNTLVLRTKMLPTQSFLMLLKQVKEKALNAYANQDLPFEQLVSELNPERDLSRYPLTQTVFAFQNTPYDEAVWNKLMAETFSFRNQTTRFDMELHSWEREEGLRCHLIYNTDLFDAWRMKQFLQHFHMILEQIVLNPEEMIKEIPILTTAERKIILEDWNQTTVTFPTRPCLHHLFEEKAREYPDRVALSFEGEELTYKEYNQRSNQLAHYLLANGIKPNQRVAICLSRSIDLLVAQMAILKVGGTYVPLDPDYPLERLQFMLSDSRSVMMLTYEDLSSFAQENSLTKVFLDKQNFLNESKENLDLDLSPDLLAYVIYTSGSTGRPNGVMVPQRGLVNLIFDYHQTFQVTENDRFNYVSSPSFDASVVETWVPLSAGASVFIPNQETKMILPKFLDWANKHQISICFLSPSFLEQVFEMEVPVSVRLFSCGGDRLRIRPPKSFPKVVNFYGPTENSCVSTYHVVEPKDAHNHLILPAIGKPVRNQQAYILDQDLKPVPIGVNGELVMGGIGVALGYIDRPDLTDKKFIKNLFGEGKLYRTGDVARFLPNGTIEFLGRVDHQVKIRGYRIEPGEITNSILEFEGIKDAYTIVREDIPGDKRLVSYVILGEQNEESELAERYVDQWQQLYEREYDHNEVEEIDFNIKGWNSSFTGEAYTPEAMREWVDCTISQVRDFAPEKILEIGCGTGLLLFPLSQNIKKYSAIDISSNTITSLRKTISQMDHLKEVVDVHVSPAHDFSWLESNKTFHTAITNSVVQYFPSAQYLKDVIKNMVSKVEDGGEVFVGDVKNLDLLQAFHLTIELTRSSDDEVTAHLEQKLEARMQLDKELLLSPLYFHQLGKEIPRVTAVEVRPKRGIHSTEMNMYRYDVVIHVGKKWKKINPKVYDFDTEIKSFHQLSQILKQALPPILVKNITDKRIGNILLALQALKDLNHHEKISSFRSRFEEKVGVEIEDLYALAKELGLEIETRFAGRSDVFDALFTIVSQEKTINIWEDLNSSDNKPLFNDPLQHNKTTLVRPKLREHLLKKLPDYMVPSTFVFLDTLPLTTNGKIDLRALPAPLSERPELNASYVAPQTETEVALADIFSSLLGIDVIGTKDNFFELGGHSLLAVQLLAQIEERLQTEISMTSFFEGPSIAELALHVNKKRSLGADLQTENISVTKLPLTPMDASFYYLRLFLKRKEQTWYQVMELETSPLEKDRLEAAITYAINKHPIARGRLSTLTGLGSKVYWDVSFHHDHLPLEHYKTSSELELKNLIEKIVTTPFELNQAPSCRFVWIQHKETDRLLLRYHHGALDASGLQCLLNSLMSHYLGRPDPVKKILPMSVDELLKYYGQESVPFIHGNELAHVKGLLPSWLFSNKYAPVLKTSLFRPSEIFPAQLCAVGGEATDRRCSSIELYFTLEETKELSTLAKNLKSTLDRLFIVGMLKAGKTWNSKYSKRCGRIEAYWAVNLRPPKLFDSIVANQFGWSRIRIPDESGEKTWIKEVLNPSSSFLIRGALDWMQSVNRFHQMRVPAFIRKWLMSLAGIGSPAMYISNTLTVSVSEVEKSALSEEIGLSRMYNHSKFGASNRPVIVIGRVNECFRLRMVYPCSLFSAEAALSFLEICKKSTLGISNEEKVDL